MEKVLNNINFFSKGIFSGSKRVWGNKFFVLKLIVPILLSLFLAMRIVELFAKWFFIVLDMLMDSINHITSKEHRRVYIFTIIVMVAVGMYIEYSFSYVDYFFKLIETITYYINTSLFDDIKQFIGGL